MGGIEDDDIVDSAFLGLSNLVCWCHQIEEESYEEGRLWESLGEEDKSCLMSSLNGSQIYKSTVEQPCL